jgi:hypothetical protein
VRVVHQHQIPARLHPRQVHLHRVLGQSPSTPPLDPL